MMKLKQSSQLSLSKQTFLKQTFAFKSPFVYFFCKMDWNLHWALLVLHFFTQQLERLIYRKTE